MIIKLGEYHPSGRKFVYEISQYCKKNLFDIVMNSLLLNE